MFRNDVHRVPAGRIELLRSLPMFRWCNDQELARVDALVYETTLPAGAKLTVQGKVRRQAFIVLAGEATVEISGQVVGRVVVGDLIGEISLIERRAQATTVTAQGPLRVLVMDPREFGTWASDPRVASWLAGEVADRRSAAAPYSSSRPAQLPA